MIKMARNNYKKGSMPILFIGKENDVYSIGSEDNRAGRRLRIPNHYYTQLVERTETLPHSLVDGPPPEVYFYSDENHNLMLDRRTLYSLVGVNDMSLPRKERETLNSEVLEIGADDVVLKEVDNSQRVVIPESIDSVLGEKVELTPSKGGYFLNLRNPRDRCD